MSNGLVASRRRRVGVASILLVLVFLVAPVLGVDAQWGGGPYLQAPIQSVSGAVLGMATFTFMPTGNVMIHVQVAGFNPVAGSHRVAISSAGRCIAPFNMCACDEVLVLADMQFNSDGSGDYTTNANATMDWFKQWRSLSLVIHADSSADSAVIGCGVISAAGKPGPGPHPQPQPKPQPHPRPQPEPKPQPSSVVGHYRVTAALGLRLRSGPGLGYATRRIVPRGTILDDLGAEQWSGGILWAKVRAGGANYWAAKTYLQSY